MFGILRINRIEKQKVAEMKDFGSAGSEIQFGTIPSRIGPPVMEKVLRPPSRSVITSGVGGAGSGGNGNELGVNPVMLPAILQNIFSEAVLDDQTGSLQGKTGSHFRQIEQSVVGEPPVPCD